MFLLPLTVTAGPRKAVWCYKLIEVTLSHTAHCAILVHSGWHWRSQRSHNHNIHVLLYWKYQNLRKEVSCVLHVKTGLFIPKNYHSIDKDAKFRTIYTVRESKLVSLLNSMQHCPVLLTLPYICLCFNLFVFLPSVKLSPKGYCHQSGDPSIFIVTNLEPLTVLRSSWNLTHTCIMVGSRSLLKISSISSIFVLILFN